MRSRAEQRARTSRAVMALVEYGRSRSKTRRCWRVLSRGLMWSDLLFRITLMPCRGKTVGEQGQKQQDQWEVFLPVVFCFVFQYRRYYSMFCADENKWHSLSFLICLPPSFSCLFSDLIHEDLNFCFSKFLIFKSFLSVFYSFLISPSDLNILIWLCVGVLIPAHGSLFIDVFSIYYLI